MDAQARALLVETLASVAESVAQATASDNSNLADKLDSVGEKLDVLHADLASESVFQGLYTLSLLTAYFAMVDHGLTPPASVRTELQTKLGLSL
jgi:hypothetical protein